MKQHCLIADPLPSKTPQLDLIDPDYRTFVQFEAASLRVKNERDAAPLITATLDKFLGAGWQTEYTPQQAFDGLMWFYRAGREEPEPVDTMGPRPPLAFDYIIDGPMIAAAFQSAYGLDLTDPNTRVPFLPGDRLEDSRPDRHEGQAAGLL